MTRRYVTYILTPLGACILSFVCGYVIIASSTMPAEPSSASAAPVFISDADLNLHLSIRAAEDDFFEEHPTFRSSNSDRRPVVHSAQIATDLEERKLYWSEFTDYENIRDDRHAMVRAAESAARVRATLTVSASQLNALWPGWPGSSDTHLQSGHSKAATVNLSGVALHTRVGRRRVYEPARQSAGTFGMFRGIVAVVQSQYYAIRNGYHGGRGAPQRTFSSPADLILFPAPSRNFRASRPNAFFVSKPLHAKNCLSRNYRSDHRPRNHTAFRNVRFTRYFVLNFTGDQT